MTAKLCKCGRAAGPSPIITGGWYCLECGEAAKECWCPPVFAQFPAEVRNLLKQAPGYPSNGTGNMGTEGDRASRLEQLRGALLDSDKLDTLPPPQPLIDGILFLDTLAWLHGKPGCGKSFIALDWAGGLGHLRVSCRADGCTSPAWYRPRHREGAEVTARPGGAAMP